MGRENIYLHEHTISLTTEEIREVEQDIINFAEIGECIDYILVV